MTDLEVQQQKEIERLQNKLKRLSEAYGQAVREMNEKKRQKGRPGVEPSVKIQILALYQEGKSMRQVASELQVTVGTVHKVVAEASVRSRIVWVYMDRGTPSTVIDVCGATKRVRIVNLTDDMISRAFGVREHPTWEDYEEFLESRCMPRSRYGIKEELKSMGLDSYDPFQIIGKTAGRVYGDSQWLRRLEGSQLEQYDELMKLKNSDERKRLLQQTLSVSPESEGSVW